MVDGGGTEEALGRAAAEARAASAMGLTGQQLLGSGGCADGQLIFRARTCHSGARSTQHGARRLLHVLACSTLAGWLRRSWSLLPGLKLPGLKPPAIEADQLLRPCCIGPHNPR
jgi:hypothetical protein